MMDSKSTTGDRTGYIIFKVIHIYVHMYSLTDFSACNPEDEGM